MTDQLALWTSTFGAEYTDRNDEQRPSRVAAWRSMLGLLPVRRVLEVGCNVGWNLSYLSELGDYELFGVEPQKYAVRRARADRPECNVVEGNAFDLPFKDGYFEVSFTCGVLIHIHPNDLGRALDELYRVTSRYVLYCEYDDVAETEVHYRGHDAALWRRDHRAAWLERHPSLKLVRSGFWGAADGFDNCTWGLLEK